MEIPTRLRQALVVALAAASLLLTSPATATGDPTTDLTTPVLGAEALHDGHSWDAPRQHWDGVTGSTAAVPADPVSDYPGYYWDQGSDGLDCHARSGQATPSVDCVYGDPDGDRSVYLVGNSKSGTYVPMLDEIGQREGWAVRTLTRSAAPFTPGIGSGEPRTFNDTVLAEIALHTPDVVALVASPAASFDYSGERFERIVADVLAAGAGHVLLLWDPPNLQPSALDTQSQQIAADHERVSYVSVGDWVCQGSDCPGAIGGIVVKGSGSHLTDTFARTLTNPLHARLHTEGLAGFHPDRVRRLAGADRYETAALLSYGDGAAAERVYFASGRDFPDALATAAQTGGASRLLLTHPNHLSGAARDAGDWLGPEQAQAVVVGGETVVAGSVVAELEGLYQSTRRIAGTDRYETAALVAAEQVGVDRVFLTSGQSWADSVSVSGIATPTDALLLTHTGHLTGVTRDALADLAPEEVVIVGGPAVVSQAVRTQVTATVPGATVTRVAGANRYETSAELATRFAAGATHAHLATGTTFADALAAGQGVGPVLLTRSDVLPGAVTQALADLDPETVTIVGGHTAVSSAVENRARLIVSR